MATWDDVARLASSLPEVEDRGRDWRFRSKLLAWERPLRPADREALGDGAPDGDILAVWLTGLDAKEALLADDPDVYFTTPHFDGYKAILIRLEHVPVDELEELMVEAWLDRAPKRLVRSYLASRG